MRRAGFGRCFNMLVSVSEVIPLPLLRAEILLTEASELEHKEDLSKEKAEPKY